MIPAGKNFHFEVGITDSQKTKRRLIFHSGAKEMVINPLHARIPISEFSRNTWLNLSIDVFSFAQYCFKGALIRSLDFLCVTASCKVRKIFTMRSPIMEEDLESNSGLICAMEEYIA